ncbi:MAG: polysaccharide biosynthesis protein [Candidatus Omnitrophica bacterium]|nr:polysaccharide biosynthesis protein [Candidatus Omnitrophota bacterium]
MLLATRKLVMMIVDIILISISLFLAFMIRFDWNLEVLVGAYVSFLLWASGIRIIMFYCCGMYRWSFRYASISEATNIVKATTLGSLLLVVVVFFTQHKMMTRSVLLIDYLICLFLMATSRFLPRVLISIKQSRYCNMRRAIIVGAGSAGEMVVRELINAKSTIYQPVGFVDDDRRKTYSRIQGIKVLGVIADIEEIVKKYEATDIIIAIPSARGKLIRDIISKCANTETAIKIVPALHKILTGEVTVRQIRDVRPADLLGRETVTIETEGVTSFIKNKVVLVTGAGGTIGSELCKQIGKFNPAKLIMYDYNENDTYFLELELRNKYPDLKIEAIIGDVKDIGLLKHTFTKHKPKIVFHSAAHKHVPLMESNPIAAVKNNIIGTRNFMYAAEHYKVESFVMISSDKAVHPTNIMGASKRIAEMQIQAKAKTAKTKFMAVRFGNVIGSSGSVVPIFKKQIESGGPVTVTDPEVRRFFMAVSEAAQLVIQAGAIGKGGEIFILDMGEQIKIVDLAKELITLSGLRPDEDIAIEFIGLRRGEKLYEEMLHNAEEDKTTKHDKIYIAQPNDFDSRKLQMKIKELESLAGKMDAEKTVKIIKELVPHYCSSDRV